MVLQDRAGCAGLVGVSSSTAPLSPTQILRAKWPKAFPANPDDVRPLASGIGAVIAQSCGWSGKRTKRILEKWKLSPAYRRALERHENRVRLDGTESEEKVGEARDSMYSAPRLDEAVKRIQSEWPKMFPANRSEVAPPLGESAIRTIAKSCGWSHRYAQRVVKTWRKNYASG
jgi:ProQ/FINO family